MYDDDQPNVVVELHALLSQAGKRAALRSGQMPAEDVAFQVTPVHELWAAVTALDIPIDGWFSRLPVNRRWRVKLAHPDLDVALGESFSPVEIWHQPGVETVWGDPEPIDIFPGDVGELVAFEEQHQTAWRSQCDAVQRRVSRLLPRWTDWMLKFLEQCEEQYNRWTIDGGGFTSSFSRRSEDPAIVAFRQAYTTFDVAGPRAAERAEELFDLTVAATDVADGWHQASLAQDRKRTFLNQAKDWSLEHGSPRLRKACNLDVLGQSLGVYRDERLALEHPGWRWVTKGNRSALGDILNPSEPELDALAEARQWAPTAWLMWLSEETDGEPVVVATFLDRQVMVTARRQPADNPYEEEPF